MDALNQLLTTFRLKTDVINNAQYCGDWAIDTSGTGKASFHIISHAGAYIRSDDLDGVVYLQKGDCVLFPRDSHHLLSNVEKSETGSGLAAALRDRKIHKALVGMQGEPHEKWTVDKLAALAAMSRSSFAARFKSLLGESPMEYLTRWRMQIAYNLLDEEHLPVPEVADRCGYDSEAAFAKAFKRVIGLGPGAVRQSVAS